VNLGGKWLTINNVSQPDSGCTRSDGETSETLQNSVRNFCDVIRLRPIPARVGRWVAFGFKFLDSPSRPGTGAGDDFVETGRDL
jgi:hypothetical protein